MNLIADIISGLSSITVVSIIGFIIIIALLSIIGKKAYANK